MGPIQYPELSGSLVSSKMNVVVKVDVGRFLLSVSIQEESKCALSHYYFPKINF